jgi:hypothetical protein
MKYRDCIVEAAIRIMAQRVSNIPVEKMTVSREDGTLIGASEIVLEETIAAIEAAKNLAYELSEEGVLDEDDEE